MGYPGIRNGDASEGTLLDILAALGGFPAQTSSEVSLFSGTSANAAGTAAQTPVTGFDLYSSITIVATFAGPTGGTLDVYVQHSTDGVEYKDYVHFKQAAAGASAVTYQYAPAANDALVQIGTGTSVALAEDTAAGGNWFDRLRVVLVSGTGVSAGASVNVRVMCRGPAA